MYRREMAADAGMLFQFRQPEFVIFWMKDTYIELDMLFVRADGRVVKIIERATPMSQSILSSDQPVSAVLELRGGAVQKLGLRVGGNLVSERAEGDGHWARVTGRPVRDDSYTAQTISSAAR